MHPRSTRTAVICIFSTVILFSCRVYRTAPAPAPQEKVIIVRQEPRVVYVHQPPHVDVVNVAAPPSPADEMSLQLERERLERERLAWEQ